MGLSNLLILLENISLTGDGVAEGAAAAAEGAVEQVTQQAAGGGSLWMTLGIYALVIGGLYFVMIRPQKKREKQMREMREGIRIGDSVVTAGGLFGKVCGISEECFVIEFGTNKSVLVPVRKSDVMAMQLPDINATAASSSKEVV